MFYVRREREREAEDLRPYLLNVDEFASFSLDSSNLSGLHSLQTADGYLPYLALILSPPDLAAHEAVGTCNFTDEELTSFQYHGESWWRIEPRPESEIAALRTQWKSFVRHGLIPWSQVSDHINGTGIVVVAGQEYSLKRLAVMLRVLRQQFDTSLPVELNFHSDDISESQKDELVAIYGAEKLFFNDLSLPSQIWQTSGVNKTLRLNYQLKMAALLIAALARFSCWTATIFPSSILLSYSVVICTVAMDLCSGLI